ncbi:MHC class II transactivator isoform X3 [Salarias fasciatus]|uniref:MHC class II transactivator isoform X3 n=1 Tax=Salarias fasciatus TaxID=181472 RepID=UPI00117658A9|nr:MHC class II transactivator isoform X3 [Salarias fasciatus]
MEENTELAVACRALGDCDGFHVNSTDFVETLEASLYLSTGGDADLSLASGDRVSTAGLSAEHLSIPGAAADAATVQTAAADTGNIRDELEDYMEEIWRWDWAKDSRIERICSSTDAACISGLMENTVTQSLSLCRLDGRQTAAQDASVDFSHFCGGADVPTHPMENDSWTGYSSGVSSTNSATHAENNVDLYWDAMMQEMDLESDFYLPENLLDSVNYEYLVENLDTNMLLDGDPWFNETESSFCATETPDPLPNPQPRNNIEINSKTKDRRKRRRASDAEMFSGENKRAKSDENKSTNSHRATGRSRTKRPQAELVAEGTDRDSLPVATPSITPPKPLHVYTSPSAAPIPIQLIPLPKSPEYGIFQTSPPKFIRLSLPNTTAAPAFIFVPAPSTPPKQYVSPLSPVGGATAPVQMSSSPPGSLSDSTSKAMSHPSVSPVHPSRMTSPSKETPPSQSSTVFEIPQVVKDYIHEAKAHVGEKVEMDLNHYVDMQVSQKQFPQSGKNSNKCPIKELVIAADTDKQKNSLELSQVFGGSHEGKFKHYILLVGNTGMGKTTLIKKLCLDWSRDCIPQFDFVFLLDGKALNATEPICSLQTLLLSLSTFAPSCLDPEAIYTQILAAPQRVLIIFDGFDELRDYESLLQPQEKDLIASLQKDSKAQAFTVRQLYSAILQRILLPGCTLLLSSRPRGTASQLLRRADSLVEVCGFTSTNVETYFSKYFTDPALRTSALHSLRSSTYLHLLCWNPGLCQMVCLVLEESKSLEVLPRTLTGLCHQVLCLKLETDRRSTQSSVKCANEMQTKVSTHSEETRLDGNNVTSSRTHTAPLSCSRRANRAKKRMKHADAVDESMENAKVKENEDEEKELLFQLSLLAWEGIKANTSLLPTGLSISDKVKSFGLRTKLLLSQQNRARSCISRDDIQGGKDEVKQEGDESMNDHDGHILFWTNPFLQSYMAAVHLCLSRTVSDRSFSQTLPFQSAARGRRRLQSEEFELTQRFAVGLVFQSTAQRQRLHSLSETSIGTRVASKQALVTKHLEGLSYSSLSPAQVLEACHCIYEASFIHEESSRDTEGARLLTHLAANLPEFLTFHGVLLGPPDVFTLQKALERAASENRSFSLDLEASWIQIRGLRTLVSLCNIKTYKACIADVITLWRLLEQNGEMELLQGAVSKFEIHPLKATQVCHIENLASLVDIHQKKRLSDSSNQSLSILAEGVPAVKQLQKLELALGPEKCPMALLTLWELLPGLQNLQHLDLENCKIGDKGTEGLKHALVSLRSLQILNLSQNCVGDQGVKNLVTALIDLPKLQCLSLYSNVISDEGAESLAAALPHMKSLTDLDVKYNKVTDVGAQSLAASLRNCTKIKTLRMWNQCIPYGVFDRLQQQDSRILCH